MLDMPCDSREVLSDYSCKDATLPSRTVSDTLPHMRRHEANYGTPKSFERPVVCSKVDFHLEAHSSDILKSGMIAKVSTDTKSISSCHFPTSASAPAGSAARKLRRAQKKRQGCAGGKTSKQERYSLMSQILDLGPGSWLQQTRGSPASTSRDPTGSPKGLEGKSYQSAKHQ